MIRPAPRALAVIVGMATEARLARGLGGRVAIGGGTAEGAAAAVRRAIETGADAVASFGLAGGLDPSLPPGALIVPAVVLSGGGEFRADPALNRWLGGGSGQVLLGEDRVIATAAEKRRVWQATGAVAVDLESGAVAREAQANGLPFAVLRAVCDPADLDLPPAALLALDRQGGIGLPRILRSIVGQPSQLPALLRLAAAAAAARRALQRRLAGIVPAA